MVLLDNFLYIFLTTLWSVKTSLKVREQQMWIFRYGRIELAWTFLKAFSQNSHSQIPFNNLRSFIWNFVYWRACLDTQWVRKKATLFIALIILPASASYKYTSRGLNAFKATLLLSNLSFILFSYLICTRCFSLMLHNLHLHLSLWLHLFQHLHTDFQFFNIFFLICLQIAVRPLYDCIIPAMSPFLMVQDFLMLRSCAKLNVRSKIWSLVYTAPFKICGNPGKYLQTS